MHMQCCNVTYDVTVPFKDVMLANKMMHFGHAMSQAHPPQNCLKQPWTDKSTMATAHPEHWVSHVRPHPPPCIWVCLHDRSLQPLYYHYFYKICNKIKQSYEICKSGVFSSNTRPNCGPPAQRSSNSDLVVCTSTVIATSIGGNQSIGDPDIHGIAGLQV